MRELIVKGSGCRLVSPNKEWNKHGFNSEESFEALYQDLFRIKYQPGVAYKGFSYNKKCSVVLQSSEHEEITFP